MHSVMVVDPGTAAGPVVTFVRRGTGAVATIDDVEGEWIPPTVFA